jgi:hypothetical protein
MTDQPLLGCLGYTCASLCLRKASNPACGLKVPALQLALGSRMAGLNESVERGCGSVGDTSTNQGISGNARRLKSSANCGRPTQERTSSPRCDVYAVYKVLASRSYTTYVSWAGFTIC